jgi:3-hydroxyacyl-CoA dehydrogenase
MNPDLSSVFVIGAGTMEHSLALMFVAGKTVHLTYIDVMKLKPETA